MAYIKTNWQDQKVERPHTYESNTNADGTITLVDSFGNVEQMGTPVNAQNLNKIEDGIANSATIDLDNLSVTGQNKFGANKDLSNLSVVGNNKFNGKANIDANNFSKVGKEVIGGLGMPSKKFIDLSFGASGTTYIAPFSGYIQAKGQANSNAGSEIALSKNDGYIDHDYSTINTAFLYANIPVIKGDIVTLGYYRINPISIGFWYAEGSKGE